MTIVHVAIPLVLALVAAEACAGWRMGRRIHDGRDLLADFGCAIMSQVIGVIIAALTLAAYRGLESWLAGSGWPLHPWALNNGVAWGVAFLLVDLMQYLTHRLSHRVNLLWACHAVHHSSEEFNYAVGLRNTAFQGFFNIAFFLPGPLLGVPWQMAAGCYGLNVLYQFWLHTRLIGRLGWFGRWFNTPSHHRVHHGRDPHYLDRNFAGVLIIWDRLLGTFREEEDEPHYGTVAPPGSWNPVWANLHGFACIADTWRHATDWRGRLRAIFGPPETLRHPTPDPAPPPLPRWVLLVAAGQLALMAAATLAVVLPTGASPGLRLLAGVVVLLGLMAAGGLLDARRWAWKLEGLLAVMLMAVVATLP